MRLADLAAAAGLSAEGLPEVEVRGVCNDSRRILPGFLFVAVKGFRDDGHSHLREAFQAGAAAAVTERVPEEELPGPVLVNRSGSNRGMLGLLAAILHDRPWEDLYTVGVTGTNGKTSTVHMAAWMLTKLGRRCGYLGTVGHLVSGRRVAALETTPDSDTVTGLMAQMRDGGDAACAMEVSSHALALHRVDEVRFDAVVFTNLTRDHLDFHGSMEDYARTKSRVFGLVKPGGAVLVGTYADSAAPPPGSSTFGLSDSDPFRISGIRTGLRGTSYILDTPSGQVRVSLPSPGRVNAFNSAGAIAACMHAGLSPEDCSAALSDFPGVPGRLEIVDEGQPFMVAVDYAHTPDALERVLAQAGEIAEGRVIVVFGAGGDRDRTKRPLMGAIASSLADVAIVTSDNPRTEDPMRIIEEIRAGMTGGCLVVPDRREAIRTAVGSAGPGDVVIIAGKGHEDYQIVGTARSRFDDREEARAALGGRP